MLLLQGLALAELRQPMSEYKVPGDKVVLELMHNFDRLKHAGFDVQCYERESGPGGAWKENRYPEARCNSGMPDYRFSYTSTLEDFTWSSKFPDRQEILRYFNHSIERLDLINDVIFNSTLVKAIWDDVACQWTLSFEGKKNVTCKWFIPDFGYASKSYIPKYRGLLRSAGLYSIQHSGPTTLILSTRGWQSLVLVQVEYKWCRPQLLRRNN